MATTGLVLGIGALVSSPVLAATTGVWGDRCGAIAAGADLSGCDLSGKDLSGEDLEDANLTGADLSDADLTGAKLGVSPGELPTYLALHRTRLEPAGVIGKALAGVCKGNPLRDVAAVAQWGPHKGTAT